VYVLINYRIILYTLYKNKYVIFLFLNIIFLYIFLYIFELQYQQFWFLNLNFLSVVKKLNSYILNETVEILII
jgi:hypothetical protein